MVPDYFLNQWRREAFEVEQRAEQVYDCV